jgi:PAS domain S-box-containing protein
MAKEKLEGQVKVCTKKLVATNNLVQEEIAERKKTEKELQVSEKKYRTVVENANEAIIVLQENEFKYFNPKTCKISGYTEEELRAKPFLDIVHPDDQEMIKDKYVKRQDDEILEETYTFRVIGKQNNVIWAEIKPVIINWKGKIATMCFVSDITERTEAERALEKSEAGYRSFSQIGLALSVEKNMNVLLEMILDEARKLSNADAGTLYLLDDDGKHLRFEILHNDSMKARMGGTTANEINLPKVSMYVDGKPNYANVSSCAALTGEVANIEDVYKAEKFDFTGPKKYDETTGYRTKSMLVIPMKNHEDETIGVLQLINSIDPNTSSIIPFAPVYVELVSSLASQAAVALTNVQLSEDLKNSFYAFIKSTATAIDEKSAYTGGHIRRVVDLTMRISEAINRSGDGPFGKTHLDDDEIEELRMAAWMHDVGKITTPQYIVDKSTKLETIFDRINLIETRFLLIEKTIENEYLHKKNNLLSVTGALEADIKKLDHDLREDIKLLHQELEFLKTCNQPGEFLSAENVDQIKKIGSKTYTCNNEIYTYLSKNEVNNLTIMKGSLTDDERKIIENHSFMSYKILCDIPFPKKMSMVPEYASAHHERLDGSGYHLGISAEDLPLQSRIIAIADIFEALTAKDRPYRTPMNLSQAVKILSYMKNDKHIDPDIYDIFIGKMLHLEYAKNELNLEQIDLSLTEKA